MRVGNCRASAVENGPEKAPQQAPQYNVHDQQIAEKGAFMNPKDRPAIAEAAGLDSLQVR
jgi:hypothetical protein